MDEVSKTEIFGENTKTEVLEKTATELIINNDGPKKAKDKVVPLLYVRVACLALALIGIPMLYLAALFSRPQPIKIEEIGGTMNAAYVEISGTLVRDARIIQRADGVGEITLFIDDESGSIAVKAHKNMARDLVLHDKVPRLGDVVTVAGTVQSDAYGDYYLVMKDADTLVIKEQELPQKSLQQIREEGIRGAVKLKVQVLSVQQPGAHTSRPWRFTVSDGTSAMDLIIWNAMLEPVLPLSWGAGAELSGRFVVGTFRGEPQLSISAIKDLALLNTGSEIRGNILDAATEAQAEGR